MRRLGLTRARPRKKRESTRFKMSFFNLVYVNGVHPNVFNVIDENRVV